MFGSFDSKLVKDAAALVALCLFTAMVFAVSAGLG